MFAFAPRFGRLDREHGDMPERDLEALFDRFRAAADNGALARVFDRTAPELLRIARHLAGSAGEAEDLLQATFLVVIERAERYDPARPLRPWLSL
jgi:DNA-directed RNA polymerase specialized sigma24 family protein